MGPTTTVRLRPLSLGRLFDQAIFLYRRNFFKFVGIVALVQIPIVVALSAFSILTYEAVDLSSPDTTLFEFLGSSNLLASGLAGVLNFVLVQGIASAALTRNIGNTYLGKETGVLESFKEVGNSWVRLLQALLAIFLLSVPVFLLAAIPCIGIAIIVGPLVFLYGVLVPFIPPVVVLEKLSAFSAVRRTWDLVRRRFWPVLGIMILLTLFGQFMITGPVTLITAGAAYFFDYTTDVSTTYVVETIVQNITQLATSIFYLPIQLTMVTLLYLDLRIRTEGFDLLLRLAEQNPKEETPGLSTLLTQAPQPEVGELMTWKDFGNVSAISLVAIAVVAGFYALCLALTALTFFLTGGI